MEELRKDVAKRKLDELKSSKVARLWRHTCRMDSLRRAVKINGLQGKDSKPYSAIIAGQTGNESMKSSGLAVTWVRNASGVFVRVYPGQSSQS